MNIEKAIAAKHVMKSATICGYGRPTLRVWDMAGPSGKEVRRAVMLALTGEKLPLAKCGVTAISAALSLALGSENNERAIEAALSNLPNQ
jgi:hypothetical protein